jgi:arylsulfatase A-like enzyme
VAKLNLTEATTYYGFPVIDQTSALRVARTPQGYSTDWLAARAQAFVRTAPAGRPWFLAFTPSAPHPPFVPAPRHGGALADAPLVTPPPDDVAGWGPALPPIDASAAASIARQRFAARETLLAVDEAVARIWEEVVARGEAERTVLLFLSDNGYSFGEHRWVGKRCPSRACVQVPFVAYSPWVPGGVVDAPVSTLDVAPTIADLAGLTTSPGGGSSLAPLLLGTGRISDRALVSWYVGDDVIPAWWAVRDGRYALILAGDSDAELFDLSRDPHELHDVAADHPDVVERLAAALPSEARR